MSAYALWTGDLVVGSKHFKNLTRDQSWYVLWFLALVGALFFWFGSWITYLAFSVSRYIEVFDDRIILPKSALSLKTLEIPFQSISKFEAHSTQWSESLFIHYGSKKAAVISLAFGTSEFESFKFAFEQNLLRFRHG
ncbi:hypothetical protein [Roseovarius albus]|nr:hypothetical protein [Roseovarius albus]